MATISFIGAGNVAFRLALALHQAGHTIACVCNRTGEKADQLVRALRRHRCGAFATGCIEEVPESDIIIIAVSDDAISAVVPRLKGKNSLIVHTSGAMPVSALQPAGEKYGVFYPLMTLSRNKEIDMRLVPFLLEASDASSLSLLTGLVESLKAEYKVCDSGKRLQMHIAAVFATNFVNYLLGIAYDLSYPDFTFLLPGAVEAVRKAFLHTPFTAQTGPARRNDRQTLEKHLEWLRSCGNTQALQVYEWLTPLIREKYANPHEGKQTTI